ncbi:hypothetical protein H9P43_001944 [Blastocladiella emersonii ATCC 22665]|nr:hypothetical protein H9P43_001944 [Blastocladiella emersonii ATCC 22665]
MDLLASVGGGQVLVWRNGGSGGNAHDALAGYTRFATFDNEHTAPPTSATWSKSEHPLLAATSKDCVTIHDRNGNVVDSVSPPELLPKDELIGAVLLPPHDRRLIYAGTHGHVNVYDRETRKDLESYEPADTRLSALAVSHDDQHAFLAVGTESGEIYVLDRTHGESSALNTPFDRQITTLSFAYVDLGILVAGSADGRVAFWNVHASTDPIATFAAHSDAVTGLQPSPINRIALVSCGLDGKMVMYDLKRPGIIRTHKYPHAFSALAFKHDGHSIALGTTRGEIAIIDLRRAATPVTFLTGHSPTEPVTSVQFYRPPETGGDVVTRPPESVVAAAAEAARAGAAYPPSIVTGRAPMQPRAGRNVHLEAFSPVRESSAGPPPAAAVPMSPPARARQMSASYAQQQQQHQQQQQQQQLPRPFSPMGLAELGLPEADRDTGLPLGTTGLIARPESFADAFNARVTEQRPPSRHGSPAMRRTSHTGSITPPGRRVPGAGDGVRFGRDLREVDAMDLDTATAALHLGSGSSSGTPRRVQSPGAQFLGASASRAMSPRAGGPPPMAAPAAFTLQVIAGAVEDALAGFRDQLHNAIQNLHLEVLRQFDDQRTDMAALVEQAAGVRELAEENRRLRAELERYRGHYGGAAGGGGAGGSGGTGGSGRGLGGM